MLDHIENVIQPAVKNLREYLVKDLESMMKYLDDQGKMLSQTKDEEQAIDIIKNMLEVKSDSIGESILGARNKYHYMGLLEDNQMKDHLYDRRAMIEEKLFNATVRLIRDEEPMRD